ncbi:hypothetical protein LWM68_42730 [Niabella sp. W65]|nr:hypothetical protein [Niabella sp. W65]MCH7368862.1 hypothetical protein [Niabella sp. W65]
MEPIQTLTALSINAEEGDKLEATYIGLSSQTITFSGQASLKFTLAGDNKGQLEEVLVSTGYNTIKKKNFTGAATTLSAKELERAVFPTFQECWRVSLQGFRCKMFQELSVLRPNSG